MAMTKADQLVRIGMPPELAKLLASWIEGGGVSVSWGNVTGAQAGVEAAVAAKTEIAALTGSSTAAEIVTALKA